VFSAFAVALFSAASHTPQLEEMTCAWSSVTIRW
jgi:hypothetical protein